MRFARDSLLLALVVLSGCVRSPGLPVPPEMLPPPQEVAYESRVVGWSVEGRPIYAHVYGSGPRVSLLVSGLHGDAPSGPFALRRLAAFLAAHPAHLEGERVVLVPEVNPDGRAQNSRGNARDVDLDRNFPAHNWRPFARCGATPESEPETSAVILALNHYRPGRVLHLRSPLNRVTYRGRAAAALARRMSRAGRYPFAPFRAPLPSGSLGTLAGVDLGLATVVFDLDDREPSERLWREAKPVLLALLAAD